MQELFFDPLKISVLASFTGGIGGYSRRVGLEKVVGPAGSGVFGEADSNSAWGLDW